MVETRPVIQNAMPPIRRPDRYTDLMPAPSIVRVKLSSEAAGAISITPVVVRDLPFPELLEEIAAVCGKDVVRTAEILRRGNLVSGATRFRWPPLELTTAELCTALAFLPDPEPARPFAAARCTQAVFAGPGVLIAVERGAGSARRFLRRATFWRRPHAGFCRSRLRDLPLPRTRRPVPCSTLSGTPRPRARRTAAHEEPNPRPPASWPRSSIA